MQTANLGNVFYFDASSGVRSAFNDLFADKSLQTFTSDNIYQFLRYSREMPPNVMVFNLSGNNRQTAEIIQNFTAEEDAAQYPIIVIKGQDEIFELNPRIAHYLSMPFDFHKLYDLIESYSFGHKRHQLMLLDRYSPHSDKLHEWLAARNISYFEVHNPDAAAVYLQKNQPQAVWIEYAPEFITARHYLSHPRIFYVDRHQDTDEIQKFLP